MPSIILSVPQDRERAWCDALTKLMPELQVVLQRVLEPNLQDRSASVNFAAVDYALTWHPPARLFEQCTGLKAVFSLGAGIDHLTDVGDAISHIPVVRMVDSVLGEGMAEYVLYFVLRYHRYMRAYHLQQAAHEWQVLPQIRPHARSVGILGLGVIGCEIAAALRALNFSVYGWSRTPKQIAGVTSYAGADGLQQMLPKCDVLVCVLPLTSETQGILNKQCFNVLPDGAYVINIGRGGHVHQQDLLDALNDGHLGGAALDVFDVEPLPDNHPYWTHPQIEITPHMASLTLPETAAIHVVDNIKRHQEGGELWPTVDFSKGY